jgi:peptide chain release factor 2
MSSPGFWDNQEAAQKLVGEFKALKSVLDPTDAMLRRFSDARELLEMARAENDEGTVGEIDRDLRSAEPELEKLELNALLAGKYDAHNAYFIIQAGQGGTEAQDWAEMLLRMYLRYFERGGYDVSEVDRNVGEEAGIKSVTLHVKGPYAYGKMSCERGTHRLVRISPFDNNARRQTSFAGVQVSPELDDAAEIEIKPEEIEEQFCRAGGPGGQNVNKVNTAVLLRHLPSGIVVTCRQERSQLQNRAVAMNMLKAKLLQLQEEKREAELAREQGAKQSLDWGTQIRSYVMQPYQLVKDLRTDHETGNIQAVLDGDIEAFIEAFLRFRAKQRTGKNGESAKGKVDGSKSKVESR